MSTSSPAVPAPDATAAAATLESSRDAQGVRIRITGPLHARTLTALWPDASAAVAAPLPGDVAVDCSGITYCDGSGLGLLIYLDTAARAAGRRAVFEGLSADLRSLFERALPDAAEPLARPTGLVDQVGKATAAMLDSLHELVAFVGETFLALCWAAAHPHRVRWKDVWLTAEKAGVDAVPVVCLLGWLMGLIISFQSAPVLKQFGAESMIPTMLAFAMVRELGPLVTAIILAGRSGSAFAAEIGTMKVTEEINALNTFGLRPSRFLVVPRVVAAVLMTPLLSVFGTLFGLIGGYVIMLTLGYGLPFYVNQVTAAVSWVDFMGGVFKAGVFALLVAGVGCLKGLKTESGPGAVGDSTTRAVVMSIVLIVVADGILGVVFYFLGV